MLYACVWSFGIYEHFCLQGLTRERRQRNFRKHSLNLVKLLMVILYFLNGVTFHSLFLSLYTHTRTNVCNFVEHALKILAM